MKRPLIKMCGITRPSAGKDAVLAGADLIGLVFYARSPRAVDFELGRQIAEVARKTFDPRRRGFRARVVAVFVNPADELVEGVLKVVRPDILQFHGEESPAFCRRFDHPFMKAHRLGHQEDADAIPDYLGGKAFGYLIDSFHRSSYGGTGIALGRDLVEAGLKQPGGFLAGGLTPGNVTELIRRYRPSGVDVSSGIELRPGVKSARLMHDFVRAVAAAD